MPRSPAKLCLATLFSRRLKALGGIYAKLTPLRPARREAESNKGLVEDQHELTLGTAVRRRFSQAVYASLLNLELLELSASEESEGAPAFGCSACNGLISTQAMSSRLRKTRKLSSDVQSVGVPRRHGIANARLNVTPPSMISPAKTHQMRPAGVVAGKPRRLHDRLCSGHVKRNFVQSENLLESLNIGGDHWMISAEDGTELTHMLRAALDTLLVEIVTEEIHAIGACQIVEAVAVEIGNGYATRRLNEGADGEVLADKAVELERHPVGFRELKVGDAVFDEPERLWKPVMVEFRKAQESGAAARRNLIRRRVRTEEMRLVILV